MRPLIKFFSSLKLTVWLLTASMLLVFFGTLDQVHFGIWQTQKLYFESFFVVWSYPEQWGFYQQLFWLRLPLPGGYLLGGFLLINLLAAHITRFQLSLKKCGLFLIHFGLILLIISELLTDLVSHESQMRIDEGSRSNFSINFRQHELVLIDRRAKDFDTVFAVTSEALKQPEPIPIPGTPLMVQCIQYFPNSNIVAAKAESSSPADKGFAIKENYTLTPAAISYDDNEPNIVSAYVKIFADEQPVGTWLVSNLLEINNVKQIVRWKGQEWELALRFQRSYYPFEFELIDYGLEELVVDKEENEIIIYAAFESFGEIQSILENKKIEIKSSEVEKLPKNTIVLDEKKKSEFENICGQRKKGKSSLCHGLSQTVHEMG